MSALHVGSEYLGGGDKKKTKIPKVMFFLTLNDNMEKAKKKWA